jgi:hypothetical protein
MKECEMKRHKLSNTGRTASALGMIRMILLVGTGTVVSLPALPQQTTGQPQQGQSTQQMNSDMAACAATATQASGYDPSQAAAAPQPQAGGRAKGAVAGAAAGAAGAQVRSNQYENVPGDVQEQYRQNQAKSGAAAGAAVGGVKQRQARRDARQQASTQQQEGASAYNQTYKSCMQARGYLVN